MEDRREVRFVRAVCEKYGMGKKAGSGTSGLRKWIWVLAAGMVLLLSGCTAADSPAREEAAADSHVGPQQEETVQTAVSSGAESGREVGPKQEDGPGPETGKDSAWPASWDFDRGSILLKEALEELDREGVRYTGYYNVSGERLDVTLEDGTWLLFFRIRKDTGEWGDDYELMMEGTRFNANGFQEHYLGAFDVITEEAFYPDLSAGPVDESTLWSLNQTDLSIARNQIYARHGRKFQDPFLNALFSTKSWYEPRYEGAEFDAVGQGMLSETERQNLSLVLEIEEAMHYQSGGGQGYETARGLMSGSSLDLDGDGRWERIVYTRQMEDDDTGFQEVGVYPEGKDAEENADVRVRLETVRPHQACYVASSDGVRWQIILVADGFSADPVCCFYRYGSGELTKEGEIFSDVRQLQIRPDRICAPVEYSHFQCQPIQREYVRENGTLTPVEKEYYEYAGNIARACVRIPLLGEKAGETQGPVLEPGDRVIVRGGDLAEWVLLEKEATGEQGWLRVTETDCRLPDGTTGFSGDWFEGLPFYG